MISTEVPNEAIKQFNISRDWDATRPMEDRAPWTTLVVTRDCIKVTCMYTARLSDKIKQATPWLYLALCEIYRSGAHASDFHDATYPGIGSSGGWLGSQG